MSIFAITDALNKKESESTNKIENKTLSSDSTQEIKEGKFTPTCVHFVPRFLNSYFAS